MHLLRVALPVAIRHCFDYLPAGDVETPPRVGARVVAPLGRRQVVGVVVAHAEVEASIANAGGYRPIVRALDDDALLPAPLLQLCRWCADYYQHPLGLVIAAALPAALRRGKPALYAPAAYYGLSAAGRAARTTLPTRHVIQRALLERLAAGPAPAAELGTRLRPALAAAQARGWIERSAAAGTNSGVAVPPALTAEQDAALGAMRALPGGYSAVLLDGVTGSGKTELYLRLAERAVADGRQVLALAPEIGLTPQLGERFRARFGSRVASYHSGMGDAERLHTWMAARAGDVDVVVGTRSAVFIPLARPGLIVVDEEHDGSYKQEDGLRYSARDLAVLRAHHAQVPVVLGSATPSLASFYNVERGRYRHLRLTRRVNDQPVPAVTLMDIRGQPLRAGLSEPLLEIAARHLAAGGQVLFFINRRGFAPVLMCHQCGWSAPCPRCDAHLTLHRRPARLLCHHCGYAQAVPPRCPNCGHAPLRAVGQGTERIEEALRQRYPGERIERFDSDRTRSATTLARLLDAVASGAVRILIGTQILAKGHDFSGLTLAALIDVDGALYGADFRALEHMAQLVTQVAGRVGRGPLAGEVILQTRVPDHPQLRQLAQAGYAGMTEALLAERRAHGLPPYAHLALLRAEAPTTAAGIAFLRRAAEALESGPGVDLLGPVSSPMERRAGRCRAQLLIRATSRRRLQACLEGGVPRIESLRAPRALRWSIDVDPYSLD